MNIENLQVPAGLSRLVSELIACKSDFSADFGQFGFVVPESLLVKLLLASGATFNKNEVGVETKNEVRYSGRGIEGVGVNNQDVSPGLPKVLVENLGKAGSNFIKEIIIWENQSPSEVAKAYGGKSAASNISNFISKTPLQLKKMRQKTRQRLADAIGFPVEWFEKYFELIEEVGIE